MSRTIGYERTLHLLAFDHRDSFQRKLFQLAGAPASEVIRRMVDAKQLIFEGFLQAIRHGVAQQEAGILVDEQYGSQIASAARTMGFALAVPVEKSGQAEFDFEYGYDFGRHIERFDPTFAKVLVRYNPAGDRQMNQRQAQRLRVLCEWLHDRQRRLLFELLIPPEKPQLDGVGGRLDRYDREVRPRLMLEAIGELRDRGVEPDVWKIEGLEVREDCVRVADMARADGRARVRCIVLGRGADEAAVKRWLQAAAGVEGYVGFAIGRTIWWEPLKGYIAGATLRREAVEQIAANYREMVQAYQVG